MGSTPTISATDMAGTTVSKDFDFSSSDLSSQYDWVIGCRIEGGVLVDEYKGTIGEFWRTTGNQFNSTYVYQMSNLGIGKLLT